MGCDRDRDRCRNAYAAKARIRDWLEVGIVAVVVRSFPAHLVTISADTRVIGRAKSEIEPERIKRHNKLRRLGQDVDVELPILPVSDVTLGPGDRLSRRQGAIDETHRPGVVGVPGAAGVVDHPKAMIRLEGSALCLLFDWLLRVLVFPRGKSTCRYGGEHG